MRWGRIVAGSIGIAWLLGQALACAAPQAATPSPQATSASPAVESPAPPMRVVLNWTQPTGAMSPIWITYEAGYFREEGLDVELLNIPNTSRVLQTMAAGEVDLSPLDPQTTVRASLSGMDVVLLFAQTNRMVFGLFGQPGITRGEQLRGKVVATTRIGASNHTATVAALQRLGLAPDRDVALRQLGEVAAIYAALQAGQVDAATLGLPVDWSLAGNLNELVNLAQDGPEYPSVAVGGLRGWVNANEEAVRRVGRAWMRGLQRFKSDSAFTLEVYRKYFQGADPGWLEEGRALFTRYIPDVPYVSETGMATILHELAEEQPALAGRQPAEWVDSRFVRELEAAGMTRTAP
jgi:ABC-type nitrate/sulfonate/bicarbonate transport system substrate-binding protein